MTSALQAIESGVRVPGSDSGGSRGGSSSRPTGRDALHVAGSMGNRADSNGSSSRGDDSADSFADLVRGITSESSSGRQDGRALPASGSDLPGQAASDLAGAADLASLSESQAQELLANLRDKLAEGGEGADLLAALEQALNAEGGASAKGLMAMLAKAVELAPDAAGAMPQGSEGQASDGDASAESSQQSLVTILAEALTGGGSDHNVSAEATPLQRLVSGLERLTGEAGRQSGGEGNPAQRLLSALDRFTGEGASNTGKATASGGQGSNPGGSAMTEALERLLARAAQGSAGNAGAAATTQSVSASNILTGVMSGGVGGSAARNGDAPSGSTPTLAQSMAGSGGALSQAGSGTLSFAALGASGRGGGGEQALANRVMWMTSNSLEQADFKMHPPQLGSVGVRLRFENDQANLVFQAPNAQVRDAIEQSLPRLRDQLAEQGITLGDASVSDGETDSQEASDQSERGGSLPDSVAAGAVEPAEGRGDEPTTGALSLVDTYA